jgi:hypothetical protein
VAYRINVATDARGLARRRHPGDRVSFVVRFGQVRDDGTQSYRVTRSDGDESEVIARGRTGSVSTRKHGEVKSFAGPRSDPFFFDLSAFNNTVQATGGTGFANPGVDFFAPLNTNAIVLQIPNRDLGGDKVSIWGSTTSLDGKVQYDRMGRPAINTVFNGFKKVFNSGVDNDKNEFNAIKNPADDATTGGGKFRANVVKVLEEFSSLSGTAYTDAQAGGLADVLLPDALPYDTSNPVTNGVFNGRAPADDVIDTELNVVTKGAVPSDNVGPHTDYLPTFPYLGVPHS